MDAQTAWMMEETKASLITKVKSSRMLVVLTLVRYDSGGKCLSRKDLCHLDPLFTLTKAIGFHTFSYSDPTIKWERSDIPVNTEYWGSVPDGKCAQ